MDGLLEPLHYAFMQRALLAAVMVGVVCAVVGTFVVIRGMAFMGDALAHSVLPGVAVGYLLGNGSQVLLFWWGLGAAILSALGIGAISRGSRLKEDTAVGIVFAGMFALGIALISSVKTYALDLTHLLFGDVLAVRPEDLILTAAFSVVVLLVVALFYKELVVISFDEVLARTLRLSVKHFYFLLMVLIAVTIIVSLQTVGIALMLAMLITPAATARLVTRHVPHMMGIAAVLGAGSGIVGLYLSYYMGISSGAAIVLVATAFFFFVWAVQRMLGTAR